MQEYSRLKLAAGFQLSTVDDNSEMFGTKKTDARHDNSGLAYKTSLIKMNFLNLGCVIS